MTSWCSLLVPEGAISRVFQVGIAWANIDVSCLDAIVHIPQILVTAYGLKSGVRVLIASGWNANPGLAKVRMHGLLLSICIFYIYVCI